MENERRGKGRTALGNKTEQKTGDNKMQRNQKRGPLNRDTAQYWMACKRQEGPEKGRSAGRKAKGYH